MPVTRSQSSGEKWVITEVESKTQQNNKKRPRGQLRVESGEKSCVDLTPTRKKRKDIELGKGKEPEEENLHFFSGLPQEILENIFQYLNIPTLLQLDCVSKTFETDASISGALCKRWKVFQKQRHQGLWWRSNADKKNPHKWNYFLSKALVDYFLARQEGMLKWQSVVGKIHVFIQHCPAFVACVQFDCQTSGVPLPANFPLADLEKDDVEQILAEAQHKEAHGEFLLSILPSIIEYEKAIMEYHRSLKSRSKEKVNGAGVIKQAADKRKAALEKLKDDFTKAKRKKILLAEELAMHILGNLREYKVSPKYFLPGVLRAAQQKDERPLQQFVTLYPEKIEEFKKKGYTSVILAQELPKTTWTFNSNSELHNSLNQAIEDHPECATEKSFAQLIYLKRWLATDCLRQMNHLQNQGRQDLAMQAETLTQEANQLYDRSLATYQKQGRAAAFLLSLGHVYNSSKSFAEANSYYDQALALLDEQNIRPSFEILEKIAEIKFILKDWPAYEKLILKIIQSTSIPLYNKTGNFAIYYNRLANLKYNSKNWAEADHYWDEKAKHRPIFSVEDVRKQILANYKLENWQKIDLIIKKRKLYNNGQFHKVFISIFAVMAKQKLGNRSSNSKLYKTILDNIDDSELNKYLSTIPPEFKFWEIVLTAAKEHQQWNVAENWLCMCSNYYPSIEEWLTHMLPVKERLYQTTDQKEEAQLFSFLRNIAQSHTDQTFVANHQQEIVSLQCACCGQDWQTANQALDQLLLHYQDQEMLTTDLLKACVYIKKQAGEESDFLAFEAFLNGIDTIHELSLAQWQQMDATANRVMNLYDPKETAPATWQLIHTLIKKQLSKLENSNRQTDSSLR